MLHKPSILRSIPPDRRYLHTSEHVGPFLKNRSLTLRLKHSVFMEGLLVVRDQQIVTGLAMLLIGFIQFCDITQYHFSIIKFLAWLSLTVTQGVDFIIRPATWPSPMAKHPRFAFMVLQIILMLAAEVITWRDINLESGEYYWYETMGLPMQCCWNSYSGAYTVVSPFGVITILLLLWTFITEYNLFYGEPRAFNYVERVQENFVWLMRSFQRPHSLVWSRRRLLLERIRQPHSATVLRQSSMFQDWMFVVLLTVLCILTFPLSLLTFVLLELFESSITDITRMIPILIWATLNIFWLRGAARPGQKEGDEDSWGFGQILPMLLLVLPALALSEAMYKSKKAIETDEPKSVEEFLARNVSFLKGVGLPAPVLGASRDMDILPSQSEDRIRGGSINNNLSKPQDSAFGSAIYGTLVGQYFMAAVPCALLAALLYAAVQGYAF